MQFTISNTKKKEENYTIIFIESQKKQLKNPTPIAEKHS